MIWNTFGLWFEPRPKNALHGPPSAWVYLESWTDFGPDHEPTPRLLTATCLSPSELRASIDELIAELNALKKKAGRGFARHDRRYQRARKRS